MMKGFATLLLLTSSVLGQVPNRTSSYYPTALGWTHYTEVYRPSLPVYAYSFAGNPTIGLYADIVFGAYPLTMPTLPSDQFGIVAVGGFQSGATDWFVRDPLFLFFAPGDFTQYSGFTRRPWPAPLSGDVIVSTGLLTGFLPLGADFTSQAIFLQPNGGAVLSEAIRIQIQ